MKLWKLFPYVLKPDKKAEAIELVAGWIKLFIHGGQVNKAYNRCLFYTAAG